MRIMPAFLLAMALVGASGSASADASTPKDRGSPDVTFNQPEASNPFAYAELVARLWSKGRRQQAAFWFYIFQERTRPWADVDEHGAGAARAALNDQLGTVINSWIASDLKAWQSTVDRALSYEARLPLGEERPDGIALADWRVRVAKARADYVAAARQTLFTMNPEKLAAQRRAAGLYVGPLQQPGPALLDTWR